MNNNFVTHFLEKKKRNRKKNLCIFFDSETYKDSELEFQGKFCEKSYLIGWIEVEQEKLENYNHEKIRFYHDWIYRGPNKTKPFEKFVDRLCELKKEYNLILIAHNIFFDIIRVFNEEFFEKHFENKKHRLIVRKKGKGIFLTGSFTSNKLSFRLFDTCKFIRQGLEEYLEELNVGVRKKKLEDIRKYDLCISSPRRIYYLDASRNFKTMNVLKELEYLKCDVIGLPYIYKYITVFKKKAIEMQGIEPKYHKRILTSGTLPSLAKNLLNVHLKGKFDSFFRPIAETEEQCEKARTSFIGGLRFYNKDLLKYETEDNLIEAYDMNSMFPYIMSGILPIGPAYKKPIEDWKETVVFIETKIIKDLEWIDTLSFISCSVLPEKFLKKCKKGLRKSFYLTQELFNLINEVSKTKLPLIKHIYFEGANVMKDWVIEKHKLKEASNTDFERRISKLILNSIIGKMGEKHITHDACVNERMETTRKEKAQTSERLCFTSCYVIHTSIVIMIKAILKEIEAGNIILYGAVDSLVIVNKSKRIALDVSEKTLGTWRCEGKFNYFSSLGVCMKYLLINKGDIRKFAFSGIPRHWRKMLCKLPAEDIKAIFSAENNCLFRDVKLANTDLGLEQQDIETNNGIDINYEVFLDGTFKKYIKSNA